MPATVPRAEIQEIMDRYGAYWELTEDPTIDTVRAAARELEIAADRPNNEGRALARLADRYEKENVR